MEANNTLKVVARRTLELPGECAFDDSNRRLIVQGMYGKIWVLDAQTFDVVSRADLAARAIALSSTGKYSAIWEENSLKIVPTPGLCDNPK